MNMGDIHGLSISLSKGDVFSIECVRVTWFPVMLQIQISAEYSGRVFRIINSFLGVSKLQFQP